MNIVKKLIKDYYKLSNSNLPILYEKAENNFDNIGLEKNLNNALIETVKILKKDVSWRFNRLNGKNMHIYEYTKGNDYININLSLILKFRENDIDLYDLINYRWGLILETFNNTPRINKKVKIMDERNIKRKSLSNFKKYLDLENKEHICFYCNTYINDLDLSIDHVIPWSYMYSDDIWNLVYVCKRCNSIKSNRIPLETEIKKLKQRNQSLSELMKYNNIKNNIYNELELAIEKDYVDKFWIGSKS